MNTAVRGRPSHLRLTQAEAHIRQAGLPGAEASATVQAQASASGLQTGLRSGAGGNTSTVAALRTYLVIGSLVAAMVAWLAASGAAVPVEAELAVLLRGMAAIKGLLAFSAAGMVWWRVGQPVSLRAAATYIACAWVLLASTVLIWQLAFIIAAAVLFHAAALVGLVVAMREGRQMSRVGRQAPNPSIERTSSSRLRLLEAAAHVER